MKSYSNYSRRNDRAFLHNRGLLFPLAVVAVVTSISVEAYKGAKLQKLNEDCIQYAEKLYGDKKAPLTNGEKQIWYTEMGINPNDKPEKHHYTSFLEKIINPEE